MSTLIGCSVEGTIESCTPDGDYKIELRTGKHVMRGAQQAATLLLEDLCKLTMPKVTVMLGATV